MLCAAAIILRTATLSCCAKPQHPCWRGVALDSLVDALVGGDGFRDCARNDEVWVPQSPGMTTPSSFAPLTPPPAVSFNSPLLPHPSFLTPHSSPLLPHSSLLTPHSSLLTPHSSLLTPPPHSSLLTPHPSRASRRVEIASTNTSIILRTPHPPSPPSPLLPHPSFLTPPSSLLIPHPSFLTPHSSLLTPHSSLLIPPSSLLPPHSSLLTPHPSRASAEWRLGELRGQFGADAAAQAAQGAGG